MNLENHERLLLGAASQYAEVEGVPLTKMSWALASVMKRPDNSVLRHLRRMVDDVPTDQSLEGLRRRLRTEAEDEVAVAEDLEKRLGEVVWVEVLSLRTYGAICRVEGTTRTLLLHLSEIADAFIEDVGDFVSVGDRFQAMLIVNARGKLGLSTRRYKALEKKETVDFDWG